MEIPKSFLGYKRKNGRVGTRNYVIILPVDDISNSCSEAVANNIKGTFAIPHSYGRLQFGEDLELFFKTIIGTGKNPNVAAVIVIGIEPKWTKKVVDEIERTGKPVGWQVLENLLADRSATGSHRSCQFKRLEPVSLPNTEPYRISHFDGGTKTLFDNRVTPDDPGTASKPNHGRFKASTVIGSIGTI